MRKRIIFLILIAVSVAFVGWWLWNMYSSLRHFIANYEPTPSITCREGYTQEMSLVQVSKLMNIPLIELTWLPDDIQSEPLIEPYGLEHVDDSGNVTCVIRIVYPTIQIDVLPPISNTSRQPASIGCYGWDYSLSRCWGEINTEMGYSAITILTGYPPDIAQKIAGGIRTY